MAYTGNSTNQVNALFGIQQVQLLVPLLVNTQLPVTTNAQDQVDTTLKIVQNGYSPR